MIKVIFEDRVSHELETVSFPNAERAYFALTIKMAGAPKVVSLDFEPNGVMHFIFHDYILRGQKNEVFLEKE